MRGAHVEHRSTEASPLRRHWRQVNLGPTMGSWPQLSQLNPRCAISLTLLFSADSRCSHSFSRRSLFNHISSMYSSLDLFQEKTIHYKITITLKARFYGPRFSGKARFSGQNCYDDTTVFSNSGNFNIANTFGQIFCSKSLNF